MNGPDRQRRLQLVLLLALIIAGAALRLASLGRASYMIDEINVIQFALQEKGWFTAFGTELARFQYMHRMPTLVILIRAATRLFHSDTAFPPEWIPRLPFALLGIATLPLAYGLGRRLGGGRAGLLCLAFFVLSPFHLYYSREAYDYALVMFFATGALWAGAALLSAELSHRRLAPRKLLAFVLMATGLLYAHLSGLVFLTCIGAAVAVTLLRRYGLAGLFRERRVGPWVFAFALPLLAFLPFLLRMLGGGWVIQESTTASRVSWSIVPALLGRLGWGEGAIALAAFAALLAAGVRAGFRGGEAGQRPLVRFIFIAALLYAALQTWMLRFARFETRYYASLLPCLVSLAAAGLAALAALPGRRWAWAAPGRVALAGVLAAFLWLIPNAWCILRLECRGYNYKGLAKWLGAHLPENGIYSYWNIYDGSGVPGVYPVPGRHMAYPIAWSNEKDYVQLHVRDRLIQFFQRFPTAVYVETTPTDLLQPDKVTNQPIPREGLFTQQVWLEDPWTQRLIRWRTHPFGDAQWFERHMDKWLISMNRPEDLPALARRRGQPLYHSFGNEWVYRKDNQMNDWLSTESGGTFQIGSLAEGPAKVDIRFTAFAYPGGCRVNVYSSSAGLVLDKVQVPSQPQEFRIPVQTIAPGRTEYFIEVLPPPGGARTLLLLYGVSAAPSAG